MKQQELKIVLTDEDEIALLEEVSVRTGLSSNEYATNIIRGWLHSQINGRYLEHIQRLDSTQLKKLTGTNYKGINNRTFRKEK